MSSFKSYEIWISPEEFFKKLDKTGFDGVEATLVYDGENKLPADLDVSDGTPYLRVKAEELEDILDITCTTPFKLTVECSNDRAQFEEDMALIERALGKGYTIKKVGLEKGYRQVGERPANYDLHVEIIKSFSANEQPRMDVIYGTTQDKQEFESKIKEFFTEVLTGG
jgi:hypothetical protein